jgi:hypothetical protein
MHHGSNPCCSASYYVFDIARVIVSLGSRFSRVFSGVSGAALVQQAERQGYERGFKEGEAAGRAAASDFYKAEIARIIDTLNRLQDGRKTEVDSVAALPVASPPRLKIVAKSAPAASGDLPAAGAMQLLMTAVTHWPAQFAPPKRQRARRTAI